MSAYLSSSDTLSALASYWLASHEQHTYTLQNGGSPCKAVLKDGVSDPGEN